MIQLKKKRLTFKSSNVPDLFDKGLPVDLGTIMTKNQLSKEVPSVRFSGKKRVVYVAANKLSMIVENALSEFCKNGYKWVADLSR